MVSHSPGPWTWDVDDADLPNEAYVHDATGRLIATLSVDGIGREHSERMIANARLLACAPELLDELRATSNEVFELDAGAPYGANPRVDEAESVILKATGGAS